ncbi:MAG: geranylgeranyl diphosphate synthase type II [Candidatus Saganbacteria bacterium]|uniref:Geranylgeranyl diphosphate synthase type II n=1 Tax=Candidatus Saganbacteria bacterium TaxID=2575572 RepID=A0A833L2U8_UNCSA|nr:MAG: geranylgeranyl diphosphate synthase type II [Candidatus Saganbacteria bacterium]
MSGIELIFKENAEIIDKHLKKYLSNGKSKLYEAMRYSVFAGGKRFRPILLVESAKACKGKLDYIYPAACAIEMIHVFTLIHDDLPAMDDSDLRRGKPTCHKVFGEEIAILAGDALNTLAFDVLAKYLPSNKSAKIAAILSEASIKVVEGQIMDLGAEGKETSFARLKAIHMNKTSALIEASVKIGAMLSGAGEEKIKLLASYGRYLGLAFQIADDILDIVSSEKVLGKPAGADQKAKKSTYPGILGLEKAKKEAKKQVGLAVSKLKGFGKNADKLKLIAEFAVGRIK